MQKTIHSSEYAVLLNWLRRQRIDNGLTMRQLAEKMGIHHSWIGKVEQGERRLDIIEYLRICDALQLDPHEGLNIIQNDSPSRKK
jgi:transcriptional regulator with XRE-family HTH domain